MSITHRVDPPLQADEVETLIGFLDYQRATLLQKVRGLTAEQLGSAAVPPSGLTLGGLVKHATFNEHVWIEERFAGQPRAEPWASAPFDDDPDWDFHSATGDEPEELVRAYVAVGERVNAIIRSAALDDLSVTSSQREGIPFSLRWIVLHLIEETARHLGHADLLRELIDGETGE